MGKYCLTFNTFILLSEVSLILSNCISRAHSVNVALSKQQLRTTVQFEVNLLIWAMDCYWVGLLSSDEMEIWNDKSGDAMECYQWNN